MSTAWFTKALLPWYREHYRPLPWRETRDPYRIWLSEVILQQTRVDQGLAYWERFVARYPTIMDLAAAPEGEILRLWQGLGYYSRARNLLSAAKQVVQDHGGHFPADHAALCNLKGVGDYTASAIASICFDLPEPVVDGNVYRVLARIFGNGTPIDSTAGRKEFRALAAQLLDPKHPGDHNQAVMELGATVCTPQKPLCGQCPLANKCIARKADRIAELPYKAGKTKTRTRHFNYLHIAVEDGIYLHKREGRDIWQGLWELPLIESDRPLGASAMAKRIALTIGPTAVITAKHGPVKHLLSHQVIFAVFWTCVLPKKARPPKGWVRVSWKKLDKHALPRVMECHFQEHRPESRGGRKPYLRPPIH